MAARQVTHHQLVALAAGRAAAAAEVPGSMAVEHQVAQVPLLEVMAAGPVISVAVAVVVAFTAAVAAVAWNLVAIRRRVAAAETPHSLPQEA
jgi:hypothetical protein